MIFHIADTLTTCFLKIKGLKIYWKLAFTYLIMLVISYPQIFERGFMTLQARPNHQIVETGAPTYEQAISIQKNVFWDSLDKHTVGEALERWLNTLSKLTSVNYRSGMKQLIESGYINPTMTLQMFSLVNHEVVIDRIKTEMSSWSEATRQARVACYISFTSFLCRRSRGMICKAVPNNEESNRTFFKIRDKVSTEALTYPQWQSFLAELAKINGRDSLIAKVVLQGGKRINEVLALTIDKINWSRCEITFQQSKTRGTTKETVITYPVSIIEELRAIVGDREGRVFVTNTGKPVLIGQLASTFEKAGIRSNMPFKVTPHVLRASTVTYLKQKGFSDSDIMKITGHASSEMVNAYDKTDLADNASKRINLVQ